MSSCDGPADRPRRLGRDQHRTHRSTFASDLALLPEEARAGRGRSRTSSAPRHFADRHGFARAYGSAAELAADPEVDVVYVASIHNDHLASARTCLEAGKAVLVEKPLTTSAAKRPN